MDLHILPECYIDTNLVETITKSNYNHKHGCNSVVKAMLEANHLKNGFAVGIVDEDKRILKYMKEFDIVADKVQLKLLKHPQKNHYLIYVVPAIEKWIIQNADEVNVHLSEYNLPHNYSELQTHTKVKTSSKDENFKQLFRALKKQKATGILLLSKWITYLKSHPYDADLNFFMED